MSLKKQNCMLFIHRVKTHRAPASAADRIHWNTLWRLETGGEGGRFPSITMYYNAIQSDTAAGADAVADAWCGYTLILVQIRVIKFKLT